MTESLTVPGVLDLEYVHHDPAPISNSKISRSRIHLVFEFDWPLLIWRLNTRAGAGGIDATLVALALQVKDTVGWVAVGVGGNAVEHLGGTGAAVWDGGGAALYARVAIRSGSDLIGTAE